MLFGGAIIVTTVIFDENGIFSFENMRYKANKIDLLMLIMVIVVFFNNWDIKNRNYKYEVIFVVLAVLFSERKKYGAIVLSVLKRFVMVFGGMATFFTLFFFFFPGIYLSKFLPMSPNAYYAGLLYCYQHGYQAGIALHYSTNAIFVSIFLGVIFCELLSKERKSLIVIITFLATLYALFLTAKRAHIVFSIFCMYIIYFLYTNLKKSRLLKMIGVVLISFIVFELAIQFFPQVSMVLERFSQIFSGDASIKQRRILYEYALFLISQKPLFGYGWGSYKYLAELELGDYNAAHNVFLQLWSEIGFFGLAVFVLFFATALHMTIVNYKKMLLKGSNGERRWILSYALYIQLFFLAYCMTGNPLYDNQMLIMYLLSCCSITFAYKEVVSDGK